VVKQAQATENWFIGSKLVPPYPHAGTIARGLVAGLLTPRAATVLLHAPAGFGKTTLLNQVFEAFRSSGVQTVWLTLDQDDADPKTFLAYLVAAMARQGLAVGNLKAHANKGFASIAPKAALAMTTNCLNALAEPTAIFFDDLHLADNEEMLAALATLMEQANPATRFFIATRHKPKLGLTRLISSGQLETLEAADLRFNEEEGRTLLSAYADPADVGAILDRTEGWPVMIQLVKLSMHQRQFRWRDMLNFSGRTTELANYLSEQIAEGMAPDLLGVLMHMATCDRFNGDLLNHLCDRRDGWTLVDTCVKQGLLITPLDAEGRWYRFHPLFREFLTERFRRSNPDAAMLLHASAARWFKDAGLSRDAVRHADLAGDPALLVQILSDAGGWLVTLRGGPALMRIIAELPADVIANDPSLEFGGIYLLIQEGDFPAARLRIDELMHAVDRESFQSQEAYAFFRLSAGALDALLNGYEGNAIDPDRLAALRQECSQRVPPILDALITHLIGYFQYCQGALELARKTGLKAIRQCRDAEAEFVEAYGHLWVGQTCLDLGEIDEAERSFGAAIALAESNFGTESSQIAAGRVFRSELLYEQGDDDAAWALLAPELDRMAQHDHWFNVYASAYRVGSGVCLRRDGHRAALAFLDDAIERLDPRQAQVLAPFVDSLKVGVLTFAGETAAASAILDSRLAGPVTAIGSPTGYDVLTDACARFRLAIALGNTDYARRELIELGERLERERNTRWLIKCRILLAISSYRLGDFRSATDIFRQALTMVCDSGLWGPLFQEQSFASDFWSSPAISSLIEASRRNRPADVRGPAARVRPQSPATLSSPGSAPHLGRREQEILVLMSDGMTSKEIARATDLAIGTVQSYRKSIYRKLSVSSRSAAIAAGKGHGHI